MTMQQLVKLLFSIIIFTIICDSSAKYGDCQNNCNKDKTEIPGCKAYCYAPLDWANGTSDWWSSGTLVPGPLPLRGEMTPTFKEDLKLEATIQWQCNDGWDMSSLLLKRTACTATLVDGNDTVYYSMMEYAERDQEESLKENPEVKKFPLCNENQCTWYWDTTEKVPVGKTFCCCTGNFCSTELFHTEKMKARNDCYLSAHKTFKVAENNGFKEGYACWAALADGQNSEVEYSYEPTGENADIHDCSLPKCKWIESVGQIRCCCQEQFCNVKIFTHDYMNAAKMSMATATTSKEGNPNVISTTTMASKKPPIHKHTASPDRKYILATMKQKVEAANKSAKTMEKKRNWIVIGIAIAWLIGLAGLFALALHKYLHHLRKEKMAKWQQNAEKTVPEHGSSRKVATKPPITSSLF